MITSHRSLFVSRFLSAFLLLAVLVPAGLSAKPVRIAALPALTPDGSTLVFEWDDDLWTVASTGGVARALTRHDAQDRMPVISPDGKEVAFMSNRDGTFQTYVMSLAGGEPKQVTFHSEGSAPQDWYPDGRRLLVRGARDSGEFVPHRFITVDTRERVAEKILFDDTGDYGHWSPDGGQLLFVRDGVNIYHRNYRGSEAATLWLFDVKTGAYEKVAGADGDCRAPLWRPDGKGFYFVNDASGCANIWEKDVKSGKAKQRTFFKDFPVITPCISRDGSTVVFRQGFDFYRWDPRSDAAPVMIPVDAPVDAPEKPTRRVRLEHVENQVGVGSTAFTADGKQIAFSSGGHIWFMDTQLKDPVILSTNAAVYDTSPAWSQDAKCLYFIRDSGDRANIWKARREDENLQWWQNRKFLVEPVTDDQQGRAGVSVDPTGKRLAWICRPGELWVSDIYGNNSRRIIQSPAEVGFDWSPDGRYVVASVQDSDDNRDVWIYSVDGSCDPYNLSRHPNWDGSAVWSPDGKCIAYVGRTYDNEVDIYYAWLNLADHGKMEKEVKRAKVEKGEDKKDDKKEAEKKEGDKKNGNKDANSDSNAAPETVHIDFDGLADRVQRIREVGVCTGSLFWSGDSRALAFHSTVDGKSGTWKVFFPNPGKPEFMCAARGSESTWTKKLEVLWVVDGVPASLEAKYAFTVYAERDIIAWKMLGFRIMWRSLRDEFYDERMNNLDWAATRLKYEALIPQVDDAGFARLVHMLNGELGASHMDFVPQEKARHLGGDWAFVTGHPGVLFDQSSPGPGLRVAEVVPKSPADRDITRLSTNDTVLSINGVEIGPGMDLTRVLNGAMPREVLLVVTNATGRREMLLPLSTPEQVREWRREAVVETARERVKKWSNGRFGYIDIEKMQVDDLRQFEKEVYAEGVGHDGLVIDVRNNRGGYISDRLLSILCHPRHAITIPRGGQASYQGNYVDHAFWMKPIVVLCNQHTSSNGEIFSQAIKTLHRGKLVGTPTAGAVISTADRQILDLGKFRIPHRAWFSVESGMDMEVSGVKPDIVVPDLPGDRAAGRDEPLKRAVKVLADEVKHQSPMVPLKRASEVRAGDSSR